MKYKLKQGYKLKEGYKFKETSTLQERREKAKKVPNRTRFAKSKSRTA